MPTSRKQSGFYIKASYPVDEEEMILVTDAGTLRHYAGNIHTPHGETNFGNRWGSYAHDGPRIIQSSAGYLEVVARLGPRLTHYWMQFGGWSWATFFGDGVTGKPAFIQSSYGRTGNFEVVAPREGGGLAHYWRNNDPFPPALWSHSTDFGSGNILNVAMIHSSFGNLELVAQEGADLVFYWRNGSEWEGPYYLASGIDGPPAFIQSNYGRTGNFEVVVPRLGGGFSHYWRDNDDPGFPWYGPINFGSGSYTDVGLIQNEYGLTVIARPYYNHNQIVRYGRTGEPTWAWSGPYIDTLTGLSSVPSTPPTTVPATREHFDFILSGDWMDSIMPSPGEIYVKIAPPGTDWNHATIHVLNWVPRDWSTSVPASAGGPGVWTYQCHVRGIYNKTDIDTGDIWSPVWTFDWQWRNPAAYITLDSTDTHEISWTNMVSNL